MSRIIKLAGVGLAAAMACSCAARVPVGYGYYAPPSQYGYQNDGRRIARSTGYDDGSRMGYHDLSHYKPFNPYPRGQYGPADHGYHREYGDRNAYRAEYERGYRAGYASTFRR